MKIQEKDKTREKYLTKYAQLFVEFIEPFFRLIMICIWETTTTLGLITSLNKWKLKVSLKSKFGHFASSLEKVWTLIFLTHKFCVLFLNKYLCYMKKYCMIYLYKDWNSKKHIL